MKFHITLVICTLFFVSISFLNPSQAQMFEEYNVTVETVAENLKVPWEMVFAPDGRIFFTERGGSLRVIENGQLNLEPIEILNVGNVEGGLLGLALDPNFEENHYLYMYYTYQEFLATFNKVVRYKESNNSITEDTVLIDKIPGSVVHDGGRIKFGPDKKLYITTGDAGNADLSQDINSPAGKILRINSDGTIPEDNPFEGSPVFSLGHRNPQGIDWHSPTGKLVSTEHGPSGERGRAHDEVNIIEGGKNYGWPQVIGGEHDPKYVDPILHTGEETWAPSGATFYNSDKIPEWTGKYFVATLRGTHLRILDFDLEKNKVLSSDAIFLGDFGRLRSANMGPDGYLYLLTSNKDGRGSPQENDDRILRIKPLIAVKPVNEFSPLPPLKQVENGVNPNNVICKEGYELVIKLSKNQPACLKSSSISKIIDRGWGKIPN